MIPLSQLMPFRMVPAFYGSRSFSFHQAELCRLGHFPLNSQSHLREPLYVSSQMGCYAPGNLSPVSQDVKFNLMHAGYPHLCLLLRPSLSLSAHIPLKLCRSIDSFEQPTGHECSANRPPSLLPLHHHHNHLTRHQPCKPRVHCLPHPVTLADSISEGQAVTSSYTVFLEHSYSGQTVTVLSLCQRSPVMTLVSCSSFKTSARV